MRYWLAALACVACSSSPRVTAPPIERRIEPQPVEVPKPDPHNFGFELVDGVHPKGWEGWNNATLATVTEDKRAGVRSLRFDREAGGFTKLDAKPYAGKRVTLRGWMKTANSTESALWLRADGADGERLAFSNMEGRRISGTTPWTRQDVSIDVPAGAATLVVGALQLGAGMSWFDELSLETSEIKPPARIVLAGSVVDPAGAPAGSAIVAVISQAGELVKFARADANGRFEIEVIEGHWGVSAHRPGAVGTFVAVTPYADSKTDLKITLGTGGVVVRGKTSARPKRNLVLRISPVSDHDADLFAVPVRDDGTFEALLPKSDEYFVEELDGYARGLFKRTKGDVVDVVLDTPALEGPPDEVVTYLGKQGVALVSADAGKGFADMEPLAKMIGNARIVALGEATHGSREIFQMKHRFLEYLVAKHGFTVFAIEANQPECRAINDYVLHGKGTARAALAGIYFWTWRTEEVLAMIEWMRAWNADAKNTKKVQFVGFDMQTSDVAHANVAAFVERIAPESKALLAPIAPLGEQTAIRVVPAADAAARKTIADGLAALSAAFTTNAKAWAKDAAFVDARHDLRILEQAFAMYTSAKGGYEERDLAMAENVGWLLDQTKARIVVWAHNGHISNTLQAFTNMGSHLRKKYKRAYLNFGFVFGEGSFQALDYTKPSRLLAEHTFGPPPVHFLSTAFAKTGKPLLVVDLRTLPKKIRAWFAQKRLVRELGALWQGERSATQPVVLTDLYDAVIYIDKTTRARPLKK